MLTIIQQQTAKHTHDSIKSLLTLSIHVIEEKIVTELPLCQTYDMGALRVSIIPF